MQYSLPITSMTMLQLTMIQQRCIQALLNRLGFNRNHPQAVVFAPRALMGRGLMDLWVEEGLQNLLALLNHVCTTNW
jgi:hypothetical protein